MPQNTYSRLLLPYNATTSVETFLVLRIYSRSRLLRTERVKTIFTGFDNSVILAGWLCKVSLYENENSGLFKKSFLKAFLLQQYTHVLINSHPIMSPSQRFLSWMWYEFKPKSLWNIILRLSLFYIDRIKTTEEK